MLITGSHAIVIIICGFWTLVLRLAAGSRAINRVGDNEKTIGKRPRLCLGGKKNSKNRSIARPALLVRPTLRLASFHFVSFCSIDCPVYTLITSNAFFPLLFFGGEKEDDVYSLFFLSYSFTILKSSPMYITYTPCTHN